MKIITGKVVSKKMQKTATVLVERTTAHPIYMKRIKVTKKYQVHDEMESNFGDIVRFVECPPVSKTKKWKVIEVVGRKTIKTVAKEPGTKKSVAKIVSKKTKK